MVIATKYTDDDASLGIVMQHPLCGYPQIPVYGGGDPTLASSFACKTDEASDFNQTPAPQFGP